MKIKHKKSQITMYILLSIIVLIGAGFVIYLNNSAIKEPEVKKVSRLAFDFIPIKNYVESCIENTGKDGVSLIGPHSGYFNLPEILIKKIHFLK